VDTVLTDLLRPAFWLAALQIMGINILLSGDNAVAIALAVRALPPRQRFWGTVLGAGCAAVLLILFTGVAATLLKLPYLKLIGGVALFWVAVKLVVPQPHDEEGSVEAVEDLWRAVRVVVIANIVMSLDNVIAVAAAARGDLVLLGLGLAISIPIVMAGSALFMLVIEKFPIVVWAGGALLGYIAGEQLATDPFVAQYIARLYGVAIEPSLWPDAVAADIATASGMAVEPNLTVDNKAALLSAANRFFGHDQTLIGRAGEFLTGWGLEPITLACQILGAAFVVVMGLYLVRSNAAKAETSPAKAPQHSR